MSFRISAERDEGDSRGQRFLLTGWIVVMRQPIAERLFMVAGSAC
jgi:hypothetical protein